MWGRGEGKALESKQPCKDARDHRAGQAPSPWCKLYHAGMERPPIVQVNGAEAMNALYSTTVAELAHRGRDRRLR